ncbi:MAG TPA: hypothetical protein VGG39_22970 [Polyangiaceae bacterium]|jgi:hypothetical protein
MKFRSLALLPLVFAAAFSIAATAVAGGSASLAAVLIAENETGKTIAAIGCIVAAVAFERGDYLRRAWLCSGLCYAVLLASDAAGMPVVGAHVGGHVVDGAQGALAVLANAASVVGTWMLARAWTVSGLEEEDEGEGGPTRARRRLLFAGAALLAVVITGWPLVHDVRLLAGGDVGATVSIASDLGDTICLALVAPVMLTALAMRGGVLRWPWGFLAASGLAWVLYDAGSGLIEALNANGAGTLVASEAIRALACAFFLSAGLAQRRVVTQAAAEV